MKTNDIWEERTWELASKIAIKGDMDDAQWNMDSINMAMSFVNIYKDKMGFNEPQEEEPKKTRASKKDKFDPHDDLSYVDEKFLSLWTEWLDYKDEIKKQYKSQRGAETQYRTWLNYADNDMILANALIRRSIENSWQGFFALTDAQKDFYRSSKSPYAMINEGKDEEEVKDRTLNIGGTIYR